MDSIPTGSKSFKEINPHLFPPSRPPTSKSVLVESDLHDEIEMYCRQKGFLYIHSRMDKPSTIQAGTPDFVIFTPMAMTYFIECKAKNGKTTTEQLAKIAHARKLGYVAEIVDNFEDVKRIVEHL